MTPLTHTHDTAVARLRAARTRRPKRSRKLFLDFLESRQLLSGLPTINPAGVLHIGNDLGTVSDFSVHLPPNAPALIPPSDFVDHYAGSIIAFAYALITSLPSHGTLTLNGSTAPLNRT
ncbi:MAG TPA: hypothetical protein VM008_04935, partial [Phycisphaerae bacterium]|nr:hypothetical protein [Phycisphaerae bacterium]